MKEIQGAGETHVSPHEYKMSLYHADQVGSKNGHYYTFSGEPFQTYIFAAPEPDEETDLLLTITSNEQDISIEKDGDGIKVTYTNLVGNNNTIVHTRSSLTSAFQETITENGELVYSAYRIVQMGNDGRELPFLEQIPNSQDPERTISFAYHSTTEALASIHSQGPGWFWMEFDEFERPIKQVRQFQDNPYTSGWDNPNWRTQWDYAGNYVTETRYLDDKQLGRTWTEYSNDLLQVTVEEGHASNAAPGNPLNLTTVTRLYGPTDSSNEAMPWQVKSITWPDGTATFYEYAFDSSSGELTVTESSGVPDSASNPTSITQGSQAITKLSRRGVVLEESFSVIEPNGTVTLQSKSEVTSTGVFDLPTAVKHETWQQRRRFVADPSSHMIADTKIESFIVYGTETETFTYNSLGWLQNHSFGKENSQQTIQYNNIDAFGRVGEITQTNYPTQTFGYNGLSNSVSVGSKTNTTVTNLLGELQSYVQETSDGSSRPHTVTPSWLADGPRQYLTRDQETSILGFPIGPRHSLVEIFHQDGSPYEIKGDLIRDGRRFTYGVKPYLGTDFFTITETILQPDGESLSDRFKTVYFDALGRPRYIREPSPVNGLPEYTRQFIYNRKGQLHSIRTLQDDGQFKIQIHEFNDLGEQTTTAHASTNPDPDININQDFDLWNSEWDLSNPSSPAYVWSQRVDGNWEEAFRLVEHDNADGFDLVANHDPEASAEIRYHAEQYQITVENVSGTQTIDFDSSGRPTEIAFAGPRQSWTESHIYNPEGWLASLTRNEGDREILREFDHEGRTTRHRVASSSSGTLSDQSLAWSPDGGNFNVVITDSARNTTQTLTLSPQGELLHRVGDLTVPATYARSYSSGETEYTLTTPGNAITRWRENSGGFVTAKIYDDDSGPTYQADHAGNLRLLTNERNHTLAIELDHLSPDEILTLTDAFGTREISLQRDQRGYPEILTDESGTRQFTHYPDGTVKSITYTEGPLAGFQLQRPREANGLHRLQGLTLSAGGTPVHQQSFGYEGQTLLLDEVTSGSQAFTYGYEPARPWVKSVHRGPGSSILTETRNRDAFGRPFGNQALSFSGALNRQYERGYNSRNFVQTESDGSGGKWTYGYDDAGQITSAVRQDASATDLPGFAYGWSFDAIGRPLTYTVNQHTLSPTTNSLNQVTARENAPFVDIIGTVNPDATVEVVSWPNHPVTLLGDWTAATDPADYHGAHYLHNGNTGQGEKQIRFTAPVTPGQWRVDFRWAEDETHASRTILRLQWPGRQTEETFPIDQRTNGGQWNTLHTINIEQSGDLRLRVLTATTDPAGGGTGGIVTADALRLTRLDDGAEIILDAGGQHSATGGLTTPASGVQSATTHSAANTDGHYHVAMPVDNSSGAVRVHFDVVATLAEAGHHGSDAISEVFGSALVPPAAETIPPDPDGNVLGTWKHSYAWDGLNQLRSVETTPEAVALGHPRKKTTYAYDAEGRRFQKQLHHWDEDTSTFLIHKSTFYLYDGWNLLYEVTRSGDGGTGSEKLLERRYTWGLDHQEQMGGRLNRTGHANSSEPGNLPGGLLAIHYHNHETGETADWYPVSDLRGDIVALIDAATGDQVATYAYSPFGQLLQASGPAANKNPIRFQSKYFDADTGLVYFGLRHYSPQMSQWLSRDPMGEAGGLNLYAYAGNNPVNYADALGLKKVREIAPANPENPGRFPRYSMTIDDDGIIRTEVVTYQYFANNMISRLSARMRITNWAGRTEVGREWRKSTPQEIYEHYTFNENGELVPTSGAEYWERIWAAYRDEMHRIGAPLQDAIHGGLFIIDLAMPFPPVMAGGMLITRGSVHVGRGVIYAGKGSTRQNAEILRANILREGRQIPVGSAAGHIVASGGKTRQWLPAVHSRNLLERYRININDAANGIPIGHPRPHNTMHNRVFNQSVLNRLTRVEEQMREAGRGFRSTRRALRRELRTIGQELLNGL